MPVYPGASTRQVKASPNLDRLGVTFDDPGLVADAGLLLTATLAQRLGLHAALDSHLKLAELQALRTPARRR